MARPITIRIKKLRELQDAMNRGVEGLDIPKINPVLYRALKIFYDEALRKLLSVTKIKTGNLAKSLILVGGKSGKVARAWAKDKARHAHLIEYGHRLWRGGDSRKGKGHQVGTVKAHPYFRPALDATRTKVRRAVRLGLQELLAKSLPGRPGDATDV